MNTGLVVRLDHMYPPDCMEFWQPHALSQELPASQLQCMPLLTAILAQNFDSCVFCAAMESKSKAKGKPASKL